MHEVIDRTATFQKMAMERIMTDTRLRGSLTDEQAKQLLGWGVAQLNQVALKTEGLDDASAETMMDEQMSAVTRILRYANKLTEPHNLGNPEEEAWLTESFQSSLAQWQGYPVGTMLTQQLASCLRTGDRDIIFQQLMDMLLADSMATEIIATDRLVSDNLAVVMEQEEE